KSDSRMTSPSSVVNRLRAGYTRRRSATEPYARNMSNVDKAKCKGGCAERRSDEQMPKYGFAHSIKWITFECVIPTPFGVPVEPEVKRMCAGSSRLFR